MKKESPVTILIPTSPINSHPSTGIIDRAIASVRSHFPDSMIVIMCDGVRPEQEHYRERYQEYLEKLSRRSVDWRITLSVFREFTHQAEMTATTLEYVRTPLILFVEHDCFFIESQTDGAPCPIDWAGIENVIMAGDANMVQFHAQWEPWIIPEHEHLMIDKERRYFQGVPMVRTWQWSQRPHMASKAFYRKILSAYFRPGCRTMIEDRMVEILTGLRNLHGDAEWEQFKLMYYAPTGSIRRTWTSDGRAGDPKWPMQY